ncbi:DUF4149 domain-containing protein [Paucibacter sp. KCTC 42545]|uniref:DUF4149 domain-containing protein n=1 Tax=Paucibacter sp. KCTC 42545 TaxID=1768242 RepID=UPI000733B544|nr:DUF4149 domain-containing protein [Paucibacter sp. KCTC 42545]ALT76919.1 hypothetical protein AT984_06685 [Paucibacter sp. KCTC 42545]
MLSRSRVLLAALWGGLLLAVATVAAPSAFDALERAQAGLVVAKLFEKEAAISLAAAMLLMLMERRMARDGGGPALSANFFLPASALFCTVAGYYALQPMMAAAKAGQGAWSFMALHSVSLGFYGLKTLLVLALAWRVSKN